jgi:hypothetical protein
MLQMFGSNFGRDTGAILTEVFRGLPHSLKVNAGIVPLIRPRKLNSKRKSSIINHPTITGYIVLLPMAPYQEEKIEVSTGSIHFGNMPKISFCLISYALRNEGVWGSGCIDQYFLDLGISWR